MKLELHSSVGITPGVKIMSKLPRFTLLISLLLFSNELEYVANEPVAFLIPAAVVERTHCTQHGQRCTSE